MKFILTFAALFLSLGAHADYNPVEKGLIKENSFPAEDLSKLPASTINYSWRFEDFATWNGHEKKMLNLFDGFQQKTEFSDRELVVLIAKDSAIFDKPADKIDLHSFVEVNKIRAEGMWNKPLDPNKVITYEQQRHWEYRNPPTGRWCDGSSSNTACVATSLILPGGVGAELRAKWAEKELKDGKWVDREFKDLIGQSEIRIYSGNEITNADDIQKLNKITATKPSGVMVQSGFWYSHAIGFSKTISVFQPLPSDPEHKTLVTSFFAFGIEKKYWDKKGGGSLGAEQTGGMFMQGKSLANSPGGLGPGVPIYTMNLMRNALMILAR